MIEQTARVIRTDNDSAWLEVARQSTCGQCGVQNGCGTHVFSKVLGSRFSTVRALNKIGAEPGDIVNITLHENVLLKSAFLLYFFPLVMMFFSALAGLFLAEMIAPAAQQLFSVCLGVAGLVTSFVYVRRYMQKFQNDERFQPVIVSKAAMQDLFSVVIKNS